jgi:hypothetical protein
MDYVKGNKRGRSVLFPRTVDEYIAENSAGAGFATNSETFMREIPQ